MKHATLLLLCLFAAATASSQSLTEIANKEKKRREESRSEGKAVREYPAVVGSTPAPSEEEEDDVSGALDTIEGAGSEEEGPQDSIEWKSVYGHYKVKHLHLENKMDMLDGRERKWCTPPPAASSRSKIGPEMEKHRAKCQKVRDEQSALRSEMRAMQSDCLVDAKRLGVSPGDARLGR